MTEALDCASRVQPALSLKVGGMGIFGLIKSAKKNALLGDIDDGSPASSLLIPTHAKKSTSAVSIGYPQVLPVDGRGDIAQVFNPVVARETIHVVNLAFWPVPVDMQPSEAVSQPQHPINVDKSVSVTVNAASRPILWRPLALDKPSKFAGIWIVVKKLAQALRGKIGLSHDAVLSQIGQKLTRVSARGGLRYFSLEQA